VHPPALTTAPPRQQNIVYASSDKIGDRDAVAGEPGTFLMRDEPDIRHVAGRDARHIDLIATACRAVLDPDDEHELKGGVSGRRRITCSIDRRGACHRHAGTSRRTRRCAKISRGGALMLGS